MLCFTQALILSSENRRRTIWLTACQYRGPCAEVHHRDVVRTVRARRPGVFELEDNDSSHSQDEPNARLVEFLDASDLIDLVFGSAAEGLDHTEARSFRGPPAGAGRASSQRM